MSEKIERQLTFLDETVAFYSEDVTRRALNPKFVGYSEDIKEPRCCYRTEDGKSCGVGRHIPDVNYNEGLEGKSVLDKAVFAAVEPEVAELGQGFLSRIQGLHDSQVSWNDNGLTGYGLSSVENFKISIRLGQY